MLEISAWNQANALRQVTVKRGLDVRDFALTTFGGSGSLLLCRLMDVLGIPTVLVPPNPGNVSAFGLLTVDVKNDYVQTHVTLADALDPADVAGRYDELEARAAAALRTEGFAEDAARLRPHRRPALLRPGLRGAGARSPTAASTPAAAEEVARPVPRRAPRALRLRLRGRPLAAGRVGQPAGLRDRPDPAPRDPASPRSRLERREPSTHRHAGRSASSPRTGTSRRRSTGGRTSAPGRA